MYIVIKYTHYLAIAHCLVVTRIQLMKLLSLHNNLWNQEILFEGALLIKITTITHWGTSRGCGLWY